MNGLKDNEICSYKIIGERTMFLNIQQQFLKLFVKKNNRLIFTFQEIQTIFDSLNKILVYYEKKYYVNCFSNELENCNIKLSNFLLDNLETENVEKMYDYIDKL